jgi:uncharacterized protein (DUF169 family)
MRPLRTDLSIFEKFNFEKPPVGVKYLFHKPEGIEQLDKSLALCEMLKEAQQSGTPFYFTKDNESCFGKGILGMRGESPEITDGGLLGIKFEIFQEPQANRRMRQYIYSLEKGAVNYVVLSPIDKLTFEPDLLILTATPSQAEIVLRAMIYSTGEMYESKATFVAGCSWLFVYPYLSGKVNYMVTGLAYGMKGRRVFPDGWLLISIPYHWIPTIAQNLKDMKWVLPAYTLSGEEFTKYEQKILSELAEECQNP